MDTAVIFGSFIATATDFRVLFVCIVIVSLLPSIWLSIPISALIATSMIFYSRSQMAPILGIPDPGVREFAQDFLKVSIVAGLFALIKVGVRKLWKERL